MKQPRAFDYMALIQTVMTVAGVAFAIGTLAPASDVRLFGRSIVLLILLIVSLALTGSAMIGIDGLREQWEYQQGDNEDALPFGATSRAIAALEGSAWLMTIALIFQMLEWADK